MSNAAFMEQVELDNPNRNRFDLSHEVKLTTDFGKLVPCLLAEAVPGDTFHGRSELFTRLAPMTFPVMHRMSATIHYFFVPYRLVFEDWETFWTRGENGDGKNADGITAVVPTITTINAIKNLIVEGSLADYLGLPPKIGPTMALSAMPFRAYQIICNEWYRNQNIKAPYKISKKGGNVDSTEFSTLNIVRNKDWERDLFTAALPWTQRGDIATFGGGTVIPSSTFNTKFGSFVGHTGATSSPSYTALAIGSSTGLAHPVVTPSVTANAAQAYNYDPNGTLTAGAVSILDFRQAVRMQELFELYARTGARYYEAILGEFGVRSPDARLNRPEYIGGGRTPVLISEVTSTAQTDDRKLGDFAGHGIVVGDQNTFHYNVQEFGYIMGILSFTPKTGYIQGIERHWFKDDPYDYLHPKLAHLGERPVYNAEVYATEGQTSQAALGTFGYQPQYAEYRTVNSRSAGNFRSSMLAWHLDRVFAEPPTLSEKFVDCDPAETSRIFNVTDPNVHHLWCQIMHNINVIRPLPLFGTPSL